jgi:type II protein arginine methyltransferase
MDQEQPVEVEALSSEPKLGELPIREHILMVNDLRRGEKYYEAMKATIRPGDVVLEIGTGAGLLSCMAARLGAKHVYAVEQSPVLHRVARQVFDANGLSDQVTLVNAHSRDLPKLGAIPEPIDVLVTETIGKHGLDEGILLALEDAKPLLSPTARIIPESVKFKHCLVNMSGMREQAELLHPVFGFDLSALNGEVKSNNFYWMQPIEPWRQVSTTAETVTYDLVDLAAVESTQELEITQNNVCDGMWVWAEFRLAPRIFLETRYRHFGSNWANGVLFMERTSVMPGQTCTSRFRISDDRLGWTLDWTIG